jgi:glycerophosphoryl diester phosphodiesterase
MKKFFGKRPLLFSHRGANRIFPENSIPAFSLAIENGVDVLETDVRLTIDNQLVVFHDATLERMTGQAGFVRQISVDEIQKFNIGFNFQVEDEFPFRNQPFFIPTIEALFEKFPAMKFNIDIKDQEFLAAEILWDIIKRKNLYEQILVGSFYSDIIKYFRKISQRKVATSASQQEMWYWGLSHQLGFSLPFRPPMAAFQIPTRYKMFNLTTPRFIQQTHEKNIFIHYWTINDPQEMERLFNAGADGIMSDEPALLVRTYQNWQKNH